MLLLYSMTKYLQLSRVNSERCHSFIYLNGLLSHIISIYVGKSESEMYIYMCFGMLNTLERLLIT